MMHRRVVERARVIAGAAALGLLVPAAWAQSAGASPAQGAQIDPRTKSVIAGTSYLLPKPIFPVSARKDGSYTVEYVFNYAKYDYTPAVPIKTVKKSDASYDTPEQAFTAFYSAIQTMDYDWMLNSWDSVSKSFIKTSNEKQKQDSSYWVGLWKQRYAGKKIEMLQRIESGLYVLILYRVTDPVTGKIVEQDTVNFNLEGKRWLATQKLADDPFAVTYPELKAQRSEEVLLGSARKPANPEMQFVEVSPNRDGAQQVFLKDYPKELKSGVQVVERQVGGNR